MTIAAISSIEDRRAYSGLPISHDGKGNYRPGRGARKWYYHHMPVIERVSAEKGIPAQQYLTEGDGGIQLLVERRFRPRPMFRRRCDSTSTMKRAVPVKTSHPKAK